MIIYAGKGGARMRAPGMALAILGLAALGIAAPTTAMASDEMPDDMPRLSLIHI